MPGSLHHQVEIRRAVAMPNPTRCLRYLSFAGLVVCCALRKVPRYLGCTAAVTNCFRLAFAHHIHTIACRHLPKVSILQLLYSSKRRFLTYTASQ